MSNKRSEALSIEIESAERRYRNAISRMRRVLDDCEHLLEGKGSPSGFSSVTDELLRCQGAWEALRNFIQD